LVQNEEFLADASVLVALQDSQFEDLAAGLTRYQGFLDHEKVSTIVQSVLTDVAQPSNVAFFIWRLNWILREQADEPFEEAVGTFQAAIQKYSTRLDDAERSRLSERVRKLVLNPRGFERLQKARQLAVATGDGLGDIQIICDIRPIFDPLRMQIEGALPVCTLVIEQVTSDGSVKRLDLRLDENQLLDLAEKAELAKVKLKAISQLLEQKSITVPRLGNSIEDGAET
jgi:hypothetical protein